MPLKPPWNAKFSLVVPTLASNSASTEKPLETRTPTTTVALNKYLNDWPGIAQVFQLHRVRRFSDGRIEQETVYGNTSLRPNDAGASELLSLNRTHWSIENNLHRVRNVTFGEDASRIRRGNSPQVLAALRNALTHLLEAAKIQNFAAALRRFAIYPLEALQLLNTTPELNGPAGPQTLFTRRRMRYSFGVSHKGVSGKILGW